MSPFIGIFLKIVSGFAFTLMAAGVKWLGADHVDAPDYPTGEVVFFRSFFALITVMIWLAMRQKLRSAVKTQNIFGHFKRGLVGSAGMFCGFATLSLLPLPDATAINYIVPLLTVMLAALVLKEPVGPYRWSAVGFGMIGIAVMLWPHLSIGGHKAEANSSFSSLGAAFGLAAAFFSAFAMIEVRKLTATEQTGTIVFYFSALTTAMSAATFFLGIFHSDFIWLLPSGKEGVLLVLIGLFGGIGQITLTESYRQAEPSVIAPFDYLNLIWALLIGWILFSDKPDPSLVFGAGIVIAAGLVVIFRERHLGIVRRQEKEASSSRTI